MAMLSTALSDFLRTLKEQAQDDQGNVDIGELVDLIDIEESSLATKRCPIWQSNWRLVFDRLYTEQKSQGVWKRVVNTLFAKTVVTAVIEMKVLRSTADEIDVMARKNNRHNHLIINRTRAPKTYFLNMHGNFDRRSRKKCNYIPGGWSETSTDQTLQFVFGAGFHKPFTASPPIPQQPDSDEQIVFETKDQLTLIEDFVNKGKSNLEEFLKVQEALWRVISTPYSSSHDQVRELSTFPSASILITGAA
ncbi:hypothetical protein BKA57DRAFT_434499 [Linnemannia elongata]|nr:hypothetical protein BKA57DRAFT_434499 [Linnemannia elongata]